MATVDIIVAAYLVSVMAVLGILSFFAYRRQEGAGNARSGRS